MNKNLDDEIINLFRDVLKDNKWIEHPCDEWESPDTGCRFGIIAAMRILSQKFLNNV